MSARYAWRPGAHVKLNAQKAGEELERIRVRNNGRLTPEAVLEKAKADTSPLHTHFEWDDAAAATQHRLSQAGELIRSITVDLSHSNLATTPVRAFVSVERDGDRSYTSAAHAMTDTDLRQQVLARAWAELAAFRKKYAELSELARIFAAIDKAQPAA